MQVHTNCFDVDGTPAEIWSLWFPPGPRNLAPGQPQVLTFGDVRIEIVHRGNEVRDGLVRHCHYPVPRYLLSGGVAESWELITDVVPEQSYRYRGITRPPFAFAEGRQWLERLDDSTTRVHFRESYRVSHPILRRLLERRLHERISRDNDAVMKAGLDLGLPVLRSRGSSGEGSR